MWPFINMVSACMLIFLYYPLKWYFIYFLNSWYWHPMWKWLTIYGYFYFWVFNSISLICMAFLYNVRQLWNLFLDKVMWCLQYYLFWVYIYTFSYLHKYNQEFGNCLGIHKYFNINHSPWIKNAFSFMVSLKCLS